MNAPAMSPGQALYEYVAFRNDVDVPSWPEVTERHRAEYHQMAEIVIAAHEARKPRLKALSPIELTEAQKAALRG